MRTACGCSACVRCAGVIRKLVLPWSSSWPMPGCVGRTSKLRAGASCAILAQAGQHAAHRGLRHVHALGSVRCQPSSDSVCARRGAEPKLTHRRVLARAHVVGELLGVADQRHDARVDLLAELGQHEAAAGPAEQARAGLLLKAGDVAAHDRLVNVERQRRGCHAACVSDFHEQLPLGVEDVEHRRISGSAQRTQVSSDILHIESPAFRQAGTPSLCLN